MQLKQTLLIKLKKWKMQNNVHPKIQELKNQWNEEQKHGLVITEYERLYHFNLLYAEACSRFHYLENCRKEMKDRLYLEFRNNGDAKTDKMAEAMARTSSEHKQLFEEVRVAERYYLQLRAEIGYLQGKIEAEKSIQISQNIEKRVSMQSGEGRY